jgi:polyhydroxyalkanoate synthase
MPKSRDTQTPPAPEMPNAPHNAERFAQNMGRAAELWQHVLAGLVKHHISKPHIGHTDPISYAESMMQGLRHASIDPVRFVQTNLGAVSEYARLAHATTSRLLGREPDTPPPATTSHDRRFKDGAWHENGWFDYVRQSYLINARWLTESTQYLTGLDTPSRQKLDFVARQIADALSPSNFLFTNPEVMRTTLETDGENIVRGLQHFLQDLEKSHGNFRITMADEDAFVFGKDIAASAGHVVYENDLMQLIQYEATTDKVHKTPVLITPAWINKYYILDLRPENSLVKWLTDQGFTVFVISWVNPDARLARKEFGHYLIEGPLSALDVIESITKSKQTALVGYCLGGTLTAIATAYLRAHGQENRIASATYLTTLVDFTDVGDLAVFIDDTQLDSLEERMQEDGYLDAGDMANTFSMLRSNDLIWSFVVNNYLLGKEPSAFDLLYWNADATRMPATMHAFYLRNMYQRNLLAKPNGIEINGTPINITKVKTPSYILATKEDHIAPWTSTYAGTQIYDGPITFTLAESGHIAGVINSPHKKKYGYWENKALPPKPDAWLEGASKKDTSWWLHWGKWLKTYAGPKVAARRIGNRRYKPIEAAPGRYATQRA